VVKTYLLINIRSHGRISEELCPKDQYWPANVFQENPQSQSLSHSLRYLASDFYISSDYQSQTWQVLQFRPQLLDRVVGRKTLTLMPSEDLWFYLCHSAGAYRASPCHDSDHDSDRDRAVSFRTSGQICMHIDCESLSPLASPGVPWANAAILSKTCSQELQRHVVVTHAMLSEWVNHSLKCLV
jgi:hypothetical protein